jgi:hypothetical protein
MKTQRKAAQPTIARRPVRVFDRAVSQITGHLKRSEPLDALEGVKKALGIKNLSEAQRSVLHLLGARANLLLRKFDKARYDLDAAGRFNGGATNVRYREIIQLSNEVDSQERSSSNSWKSSPSSHGRSRTRHHAD